MAGTATTAGQARHCHAAARAPCGVPPPDRARAPALVLLASGALRRRHGHHNGERAARCGDARHAEPAGGEQLGPLRGRALARVLRDHHVQVLQAALEHRVAELVRNYGLRAATILFRSCRPRWNTASLNSSVITVCAPWLGSGPR